MSLATEQELTRLDALLMRVLDDEASDDERRELLALADADARLAELIELRRALREAVLAREEDAVEVVGAVMAALQIDDDWDLAADSLRGAVLSEAEGFDIADLVMASVAPTPVAPEAAVEAVAEDDPGVLISALHDGELSPEQRLAMASALGRDRGALQDMSDYADLGRHIREALADETRKAELAEVWTAVAPAIGLSHAEEIPGWEPYGEAIREAVMAAAVISPADSAALTDRVMDRLPRPLPVLDDEGEEISELDELIAPGEWQSWLVRLSVPALVLAAGLLLVLPNLWRAPEAPEAVEGGEQIAHVIQPDDRGADPQLMSTDSGMLAAPVQVESLETADDVLVQVMQFEDDGPLFLMIDTEEAPPPAPGDGASL